MNFHYPTYDEWLAGLPEARMQATLELVAKLRANGAHDPETWARSEISEDFAQLARYLLLKTIWDREIERWIDAPDHWLDELARYSSKQPLPVFTDAVGAIKRLRECGASPTDLGTLARLVAYSTAFGVVYRIDEGRARSAEGDVPGWQLRETNSDGTLTGRDMGGIHESLLSIHEGALKKG